MQNVRIIPSSNANTKSYLVCINEKLQTHISRTSNMLSKSTEISHIIGRVGNNGRLRCYFCSEVVFNLSHKVLSDLEIELLDKGLGFSPTLSFINEAGLKRDFADFSRKMRCKWHFRNDITESFRETPPILNKSTWNPPQGHPALEMLLSQMKADVFSLLPGNTHQIQSYEGGVTSYEGNWRRLQYCDKTSRQGILCGFLG